jgi:hypothetical protein
VDLSPSGIAVSFLVGGIGYVLFHYGKKSARIPQIVSGLSLMVFPMFVTGVGWMLGITALILAAFWLCLRVGM